MIQQIPIQVRRDVRKYEKYDLEVFKKTQLPGYVIKHLMKTYAILRKSPAYTLPECILNYECC